MLDTNSWPKHRSNPKVPRSRPSRRPQARPRRRLAFVPSSLAPGRIGESGSPGGSTSDLALRGLPSLSDQPQRCAESSCNLGLPAYLEASKMFSAPGNNSLALAAPRPAMELANVQQQPNQTLGPGGKQRTSSLEAPIMLLTGHQSAVYCMKFNPAGTVIASGSHDRDIFLWYVHGECKNFMVLRGHKNAILDLQWTIDGTQIISASPDKTVRVWDVETGKQVKKMAEHSSFVNSCCPARKWPPLVVSGSDDGTAKLWDLRQRGAIQTLPDKYQITAVSFSEAADKVFTGGLDNDVKWWDLRKNEVTEYLKGHQDMITGMQLSPDGSYLLTNAMDNELKIWDLRPYAPENRNIKTLTGHQHNFEKNLLKCSWSPDNRKVTAGSADRMVYIWDTTSRRILYKLPGHNGSVNETAFHPTEPIIGSCGSDKQIYLGEL
ncbi:hypothetical protein EJB05_41797, partial [Eragrostis curvula]